MSKRIVSLATALILTVALAAGMASAQGAWTPVRGYSGDLGSVTESGGVVTFKGYGGVSYDGTSSTGMAAEFQVVSHPESGYWFSFALVDTPNVFWRPDGSESHGLIVTFTVTSTGVTALVRKIVGTKMSDIGSLSSNTGTTNVKHTLAFYLENNTWHVVLDGGQAMTAPKGDIPLGGTQYFCAGANGTTDMEMKVSNVYADGAIPKTAKTNGNSNQGGGSTTGGGTTSGGSTGTSSQPAAVNPGNPHKSLNDFSVVRGYSGAAGSAVMADSRYVLKGYGGVSYKKGVQNAAAVKFKLGGIPETSYWFCIGLLDTPNVFWKADASESKGLILTLSENFDNELVLQVRKLAVTGYETLHTIYSKKLAVDTEHLVVVHREEDKWIITLNNESRAEVEADSLDLGGTSYLCVGANADAGMLMSFSQVFLDGEVSDEQKYVPAAAEEKELIGYTEDGLLKIGDVVQGDAAQYYKPDNQITTMEKEIPKSTYILAGLAALAVLTSIAVWVIAGIKSGKARKKTKTEALTEALTEQTDN